MSATILTITVDIIINYCYITLTYLFHKVASGCMDRAGHQVVTYIHAHIYNYGIFSH